ncbi:MAG: DNA/RNA nuclease SfsA [Deltaproteobacteria bacterium]|nr:DNA/RNA nuclease SfsA [Deltaproteobacteria bacterium]MBN2671646.1 DNA/RNA nuclease SfsA [Deltaproteobacteria bacterium]
MSPLQTGKLIQRYKRFLADIQLDSGEQITAHVPNTGSMLSTKAAGSPVAVSYHPAPHRKLKWTLELVKSHNTWVGVNTSVSNRMVEEAIEDKKIKSLVGYDHIRREVKYGVNSRVDLLLERADERCYVEVKNVTYKDGDGAYFPDAVTERGRKHLRELTQMVKEGHRAVIFFLVNRNDCSFMSPAADIDPAYAEALITATDSGVLALAYRFEQHLTGYRIDKKIPIRL